MTAFAFLTATEILFGRGQAAPSGGPDQGAWHTGFPAARHARAR